MDRPDDSRYHEPIQLPRPRGTRTSRHHLFWSKAYMAALGLSEFRELPCASIMNLDSMVHTVLHQHWTGMLIIKRAAHLDDLVTRTNVAVELHNRRRCGCYDMNRNLVVNVLNLNASHLGGYHAAPCTGATIDCGMYSLMLDYYNRSAPHTRATRTLLKQHCDSGGCSCWIRTREGLVRQYPTWHHLAANE